MNNHNSRSGLFLMELIISIFIFSIAATICIQLFIGSHILSKKSVALNNAVIWCQNMAEGFYATDGNLHSLNNLLDNSALISENEIRIIYDDNFIVSGILNTNLDNEYLLTLDISCINTDTSEIIYSLKPVLYKKEK